MIVSPSVSLLNIGCRAAFRQDNWKATWQDSALGTNDWQLFNLAADISERNDLAGTQKEKLNDLIQGWEEYRDEVGVVLPTACITTDD